MLEKRLPFLPTLQLEDCNSCIHASSTCLKRQKKIQNQDFSGCMDYKKEPKTYPFTESQLHDSLPRLIELNLTCEKATLSGIWTDITSAGENIRYSHYQEYKNYVKVCELLSAFYKEYPKSILSLEEYVSLVLVIDNDKLEIQSDFKLKEFREFMLEGWEEMKAKGLIET